MIFNIVTHFNHSDISESCIYFTSHYFANKLVKCSDNTISPGDCSR